MSVTHDPISVPTLREAFDEYLEHAEREQSTLSRYMTGFNLAHDHFGDRRLDGIPPAYWHEFIRSLKGRERSTIRNLLAGIQNVYRRAKRSGLISENPLEDVGWVIEEVAPDRKVVEACDEPVIPFTKDEQCRMLDESYHGLHMAILLGLKLGLRRSEALGLRWEDVHAEPPHVQVVRRLSRGKIGPVKSTAARRRIPLSPKMQDSLCGVDVMFDPKRNSIPTERLRRLFVVGNYQEHPQPEWRFTARFREHLQALHIEPGPMPFHRLRHTFASELLAAGVPIELVSMWLGHSSSDITRRVYAHFVPKSDHVDLIGRLDE